MVVNPAKPRRRRRNVLNPRRRRRHNPRLLLRRRRHNPPLADLVRGGLFAAAGAMTHSAINAFIPIRSTGLVGIGVQLATAWVTSWIGDRVIATSKRDVDSYAFSLGAAASVGKHIIDYALGLVRGPLTGAASTAGVQVQAPASSGMGLFDIVPYDETPAGWRQGTLSGVSDGVADLEDITADTIS
jgi:hypothetical protein